MGKLVNCICNRNDFIQVLLAICNHKVNGTKHTVAYIFAFLIKISSFVSNELKYVAIPTTFFFTYFSNRFLVSKFCQYDLFVFTPLPTNKKFYFIY